MEKNQKGLPHRTPAKSRRHDRDAEGRRIGPFKSFWKALGKPASLKAFARRCSKLSLTGDPADTELSKSADRWLFNKRVNTSAIQLGLGRTSKSKAGSKPGSASGKKPSKKDFDGRER